MIYGHSNVSYHEAFSFPRSSETEKVKTQPWRRANDNNIKIFAQVYADIGNYTLATICV